MSTQEDWLGDPLKKSGQLFGYLDLLPDEDRNELWKHYHVAARVKLEGAAYYCRQVLGTASMTLELGSWDINFRMLEWHLDAFFFELVSAYEVVLQELNALYSEGSPIEESKVKWESVKPLLKHDLAQSMQQARYLPWFRRLRDHRNSSAHHSHKPLGMWSAGLGDRPWEHETHGIQMAYLDTSSQQLQLEPVNECQQYLKSLLHHIRDVWRAIHDDLGTRDSAPSGNT